MANAAKRLPKIEERVLLFLGMIRKGRTERQHFGQSFAKAGGTDAVHT